MRPAQRRTWQVGDRFSLNRWREGYPATLVFEITARTPGYVYFWNEVFDATARLPKRSRRQRWADFYRAVARRELVRIR